MLLAARTTAPEVTERRHEKRGKDEIILTVYRAPGGYYTYSIQCRLGRFVRSAFPHNAEEFATTRDAKRAAAATLRQWTRKSRATKKRLLVFDLLSIDQIEFEF